MVDCKNNINTLNSNINDINSNISDINNDINAINSNFEWKVLKTSVQPESWVWVDFTKYKEILVNIVVGDEEYQTIIIPVIFLNEYNRRFDISNTAHVIANNTSLYFVSADEGSVMALIAR